MKIKTLAIVLLAGLLASCGNDEPTPGGTTVQVKDESDRIVLIGADDGKVYNMKGGSTYADLPGCTAITSMSMHGEDYYATGTSSSGMLTYWVNGRAIALNAPGHTVDVVRAFDDVYVLGSDNVLYVNASPTVRLDVGDAVAIVRDTHGYGAVGNRNQAITYHTGQAATTLAQGNARATGADLISTASATTFNVSGYIYQTVNGQETNVPCLWLNGSNRAMNLDINYTEREQNNHTYHSGRVMDVAHRNQSIIAVGSRRGNTTQVATVWITSSSDDTDDIKTYWQPEGNIEAQAQRVLIYGSDIYVMTVEHNLDTDSHCTRIWMNHELKGTVNGIVGRGFVVI